jgi:CheY-like chemotaxis protein
MSQSTLVPESATILAVDDVEASRYAVARTLKIAGFTVLEAATGTQALEMARQRPDLIVLDIRLPDIRDSRSAAGSGRTRRRPRSPSST